MDEYSDIEERLNYRPALAEERNHPNHWYNRASDLHASAGALWYVMKLKDTDVAEPLGLSSDFSMGGACRPVYHMLCGLSLELILKAVIVKKGTKPPQNHYLNKLVSDLGIKKTPHEANLLRFYEESILWTGKYPLPKRCGDDDLNKYWALAGDVLTVPVSPLPTENRILQFRESSGATDWGKYELLWLKYSSIFTSA
jgi:hypothetical protein